jgi:hypothetical protein
LHLSTVVWVLHKTNNAYWSVDLVFQVIIYPPHSLICYSNYTVTSCIFWEWTRSLKIVTSERFYIMLCCHANIKLLQWTTIVGGQLLIYFISTLMVRWKRSPFPNVRSVERLATTISNAVSRQRIVQKDKHGTRSNWAPGKQCHSDWWWQVWGFEQLANIPEMQDITGNMNHEVGPKSIWNLCLLTLKPWTLQA